MHKSPYFGRIDFKEEGESAAEQIYIGVATLTDASGENFFLYMTGAHPFQVSTTIIHQDRS